MNTEAKSKHLNGEKIEERDHKDSIGYRHLIVPLKLISMSLTRRISKSNFDENNNIKN